MNGPAGIGKSTIARTIAERLFADGQLGASFFCSRGFRDRRYLPLVIPTLAAQLAYKHKKFQSILIKLIQSDPGIASKSLYGQMEKLIVQPLKESNISTVIIIDGLDECDDNESASAVLSVLGQLVSRIPKVKIFLTGCPEPYISGGFYPPLFAKTTDVFVLHEIKPDQFHSDIWLFFKTRLMELADHQHGLDNWPTREQLDQLCRQAEGLFVYATALVRCIDNNKWDPRKWLDTILQPKNVVDYKSRTLDSLYTSILQKAFGDNRPKYDDKTCSILAAVVLASDPLSPSTIAMLLGFNTGDIVPILSSVNSLLILQENDNHTVQPFHISFPDFITNPAWCVNQGFYISPPIHHLELLVGCLDLMNQTLRKNMCKLPDAVANSDISDLRERIGEYIGPALQYACTSWHIHLIGAHTIPAHAPTVTPTLRQFLGTKFLFWLEILSVLGTMRSAVEALQIVVSWLGVSHISTLNV